MPRVRMLAWSLILIAQLGFLVSGPAFFGFIPVFGIGEKALAFDLDQRSDRCMGASQPIEACTAVIDSPHATPAQIARAYVSRGRVYIGLRQPDNAARDFTAALERDPDNAFAWYQRAGVHGREGRYALSIADYNESLSRASDNPKAHFGRGLSLLYTGRTDGSLGDFDEAIRLDPGYGEAFLCRGHAWYRKGDHVRALADYDKAIHLHPYYMPMAPWRSMAQALVGYGPPMGTLGRFVLDVTAPPGSPPPHRGYAVAFDERGRAAMAKTQYAKAILDFEEAMRLDPDSLSARFNLKLAQTLLLRLPVI